MKSNSSWFDRRPNTASALIAAYALVVIFTHDPVQQLALSLQRSFGIDLWNRLFLLGGIATAIPLLYLCVQRIRWHRQAAMMTGYAVLIVVMVVLGYSWLMVKFVESVHYLQYAVLAILLYGLTGRPTAVLIVAALVGIVDEWYQFAILYPGRGALDMNDVIMNAVGAVSGLYVRVLFVRSHVEPCDPGVRWSETRRWIAIWIGLYVLVGALSLTGAVGLYADTGVVSFYKKRTSVEGIPERKIGRTAAGTWYSMKPPEAFALLFVIPLVFAGLDRVEGTGNPENK